MACPCCVAAGGFFFSGVALGAAAIFAYAKNPEKRPQVIAVVAGVALACVAYLFKSGKVHMPQLAKNQAFIVCALAVLGIVAVRVGYKSVTP